MIDCIRELGEQIDYRLKLGNRVVDLLPPELISKRVRISPHPNYKFNFMVKFDHDDSKWCIINVVEGKFSWRAGTLQFNDDDLNS